MIFEEIPRFLKSLLFFCRCDVRLSPNTNITQAEEPESFKWHTTGPGSELRIRTWRPITGWVLVRLHIEDSFRHEPELAIHFNGDADGGTRKTLFLIHSGHGEYQAIGIIPFLATRAYFDLGQWEGDFTLKEFSLYNVPKVFVRRIGIGALDEYHTEFAGQGVVRIRNTLAAESQEFTQALDERLETRLHTLIEPDDRVSYDTWIRRVEVPELERQQELAENLDAACPEQPLVSLLLPVDSGPVNYFTECLESVRAQLYPRWELCVVRLSDSSEAGSVTERYAARDQRIRLDSGVPAESVSRALNAALEMARGQYVTQLNPRDKLAPDALLSVIERLQKNPRLKIIYSDDDQIDAKGRRHSPRFKCDWNPDLLYSIDYIGGLCVYETGLLRKSGGFREGFEGGEGYDLLLRASGQASDGDIGHVSAVLYHRREHGNWGTGQLTGADAAWDSGVRALQSFFYSRGNGVRIERGLVPSSYRTKWPIPYPPPLVSIIIPTRDNHQLLEKCISSVLEKTEYPRFEILVIDNASGDPATLAYLGGISRDQRIRVLEYPGSFNYSAINNFGAAEANGDMYCLLNDDVKVIERNWLREMASHACRHEIGCVGAKLVYPDGTIQHGGVICGIGGIAGHAHRHFRQEDSGYCARLLLTQNLSAVTAACMVMRREVWEKADGMNAKDLPVAYNDVDFCLRVRRQGLRIVWTPYALMTHQESASRGPETRRDDQDRVAREKAYMRATWGESLGEDLYYNPHLTLKREDFSIRIAR